jgi:hypothetical protein
MVPCRAEPGGFFGQQEEQEGTVQAAKVNITPGKL